MADKIDTSKNLTPLEERFLQEYMIHPDQTKAYIAARGVKLKGSSQAAYRLAQKPRVKAAIAAAQKKRADLKEIDANWVLMRLVDEANADMADLYNDDETLKPIKEWPLVWRQGLVAGLDTEAKAATGLTVGPDGKPDETLISTRINKVKISDRIKRLELIGKHIGVQAFAERKEITGKDGGPVEIDDHSELEIARRVAFLLAKAAQD